MVLATKFSFPDITDTHQNDVDGRAGGLKKQTVPFIESQKKNQRSLTKNPKQGGGKIINKNSC